MKKVLAIVLAVVMVCTMALAADIVIKPGDPINPGTPSGADYTVMNPGTTIALDLGTVACYVKDGKFVPANNVVTVTFAKGAELVKSQGWVKVSKSTQGALYGDKDTDGYQYQITFKSDLNKIADKKIADISISGVSFKATGYNAVDVMPKATTTEKCINYAFGWEKVEVPLAENDTTLSTTGDRINVFTPLTDKAGKEVSALEVKTTEGIVYNITKGLATYVTDKTINFTNEELNNGTVAPITSFFNTLNIAGKVNYAKGVNADKALKAYAKTADGKVLSVPVTEKDGVMSFTVPALSKVIITEATLKTVGTAGSTGTTTGTTTNPGTGANDVVGVAAALAVVALVSGAAISLKK
jgi:hypothetical protein